MPNQRFFQRCPLRTFWTGFSSGALALLLVGGISGCSEEDKLGRQEVKGRVIFDGQPLESGSIRFEPQNATGIQVSAGAVVNNGQFVIEASQGLPKGSYKVSISSPEGGNRELSMPVPNAPAPRERIPEKYNINTTLTVELPIKTQNGLSFELTSK